MSDDSSTSTSNTPPHNGFVNAEQEQEPAAQTEMEVDDPLARERRRRVEVQLKLNRKRAELLDHLIRTLDIVVFCELSVLYYMEYDRTSLSLSYLDVTIHSDC